jgi:hypothetical protein
MTIVGKILVIVVLVFSCAVCAFAVSSYYARYNWELALREQTKHAKTAQFNADQFYQEKLRAVAEKDAAVATLENQIKNLREEIDGYKTQLAGADKKVKDAEARSELARTTEKASQADVIRRQADTEKLRETLGTEITRNSALVKAELDMRNRAVGAEIQAKSLTVRLAALENQLQESAKEIARAKQSGSSGRSALASGANPPPENVEGLIRTADSGGLLKLTIGSDAGLAKGHTLELYRLSSVASQSKYLGRVRILEVTPHEAVAQPLGRLSDKPQPGDHVASRILGGA